MKLDNATVLKACSCSWGLAFLFAIALVVMQCQHTGEQLKYAAKVGAVASENDYLTREMADIREQLRSLEESYESYWQEDNWRARHHCPLPQIYISETVDCWQIDVK